MWQIISACEGYDRTEEIHKDIKQHLLGIYYAKTWGKSTTEGGLWSGDIILGQPETDYRGWPAA